MSPSPTVNAWGAASDQWKKQQGAAQVPTSQAATPQPVATATAPVQAATTVQQQPWKAPRNYYGQSQGTQGMVPAPQQPYQPAAQPWSGAGMGPGEGASFGEEQPSDFGQAPMESAPPQMGAQSQRRSPMSQMGMQPKQRNYYGS